MQLTSQRRFALQWAIVAFVTLLLLAAVVKGWRHGGSQDFADFYCAGATTNAGGDAYLWRDLDACGARGKAFVPPFAGLHRAPSPTPGYDIALFRLLAQLPYMPASYVWLALSTGGLLAAVYFLSEAAEIAPLLVFAVLAVPIFRTALSWGQLSPCLIAFIGIASYAIRKRAYELAGVATACTLIEPHIGLPICLATACWLPRARLALGISCAALLALSVATLGIGGNLEFVKAVLPAHMVAEIPFNNQYSLTWLLYWLGADQNVALAAGKFSYYVAIVLGVVLARKLAQSMHAPEVIPIVPAAIAVIGGPFVHLHQVEVAALCALVLAGRCNSGLAWIAVALLSVVWYEDPWNQHSLDSVRVGSGLVMAIVVGYALHRGSVRTRTTVAWTAVAVASYFGATAFLLHTSSGPFRYPQTFVAYSRHVATHLQYASVQWGFIQRSPAKYASLRDLLVKLPIWSALVLIVLAAYLQLARKPERFVFKSGKTAPVFAVRNEAPAPIAGSAK